MTERTIGPGRLYQVRPLGRAASPISAPVLHRRLYRPARVLITRGGGRKGPCAGAGSGSGRGGGPLHPGQRRGGLVTEQGGTHEVGLQRSAQVPDLARGRFPKAQHELPDDAVEHLAKQTGVPASELALYDFTSRAAKRQRSEIRDATGWHECSQTDTTKTVSHLVDAIWHDERRDEQVRIELYRYMRAELIEPPTPDQITAILKSALHQADERAVCEVAARLARAEGCPQRLDALVFTDPTGDTTAEDADEDTGDADTADADEDSIEAVLSQIKAHPGNVSLNSLLDEITKLKQVGAVDIPADAFTWTWRGRRRSFWRGRAMARPP
uniref:DUF4158 domain-containing protein n=1 Tax=Streptomyces sp. NBC_00857 TaxID=2975851 RepID=UPI002F907182|nr:DUF4158 domain-containing protein [Streptomyces sp. NBC_00857]